MSLNKVKAYWSDPESGKVRKWMEREAAWTPDDPEWSCRPDVTFVREFLAPRFAGRSVLDIGAGSGRWVHLWRACDIDLMSADWSPPFFEVLERRSDELGARCARFDVTESRLEERFDLVFGTMFLMHLHPTRIATALRHIDAMGHGDFCFTTWNHPTRIDDDGTEEIQSFSHDYDRLFDEVGWRTVLRSGLDFGKANDSVNRLWFLRRERDVS
ncbi:MAG: Methyltransferase domain [Planctomycetota bacterium]